MARTKKTTSKFPKMVPIKEALEARCIPEPNSGCWLWLSFVHPGRGYAYYDRKPAYRRAYEAWKGPIPVGLHVLHTCDNRICINPDHLFLGTNADNVADCIRKGRATFQNYPAVKGEQNGQAKLTTADVIEIRRLGTGRLVTQKELSRRFRINARYLRDILTRRAWKHVA